MDLVIVENACMDQGPVDHIIGPHLQSSCRSGFETLGSSQDLGNDDLKVCKKDPHVTFWYIDEGKQPLILEDIKTGNPELARA